MEKIDKVIKILNAFKKDNKIEFSRNGEDWYTCDDLIFILDNINSLNIFFRKYREPKYRPYANVEEFLKDSKKHNNWFCTKDRKTFHMADSVYNNFDKMYIDGQAFSLNQDSLFTDYMWEDDGSPCGILEE